MKHRPDARHFVYRCFAADGELLYIGATSNYDERVKEYDHRPRVARIERDEYPTRAEAFAAERAAIREHQPPWNCQHTDRAFNRRGATTVTTDPDLTLTEAAKRLKMSTKWVRNKIKAGEDPASDAPFVPHTRRGNKIIFTPEQFEALRQMDAKTPPPVESITTGRKKRAS